MANCIIFGGNGFIGSHLVEGLVSEGHNVKIFDKFLRGTANLSAIIDRVQIIKGDFTDDKDVKNALQDVDYVFHFISTTNPATAVNDPVYDIETNIIGSVKLFQQAMDSKVKKIVYPSSGGTVYGEPLHQPCKETDPTDPINPYAISKLAIEKYLGYFNYKYGMDYSILRYSNPYGERQDPFSKQGVIPIFLDKIKKGEKPVIYGDGSAVRDYIYIKDLVDATVAVLANKTKSHVFNVGSGEGTSLNELICVMSEVAGNKIEPEYIPDPGVYISKIILDISRIKEATGWSPSTSLKDGIEKTWQWTRGITIQKGIKVKYYE